MLIAQQNMMIQKWGNGLGLRITKPLSQLAHFEQGTLVSVEVTPEGMMIKRLNSVNKKFKNPFSESSLLNTLTPYTAHLDELVTPLSSELEKVV